MKPADDMLASWVRDARERTFDLASGLDDAQLMGPRLAIVNPMRWEIGHVAWFQERWVLRHARGEPSLRGDADALYDSIAIPHDDRWDLPLPSLDDTFAYMRGVRDRVLALLERSSSGDLDERDRYFITHTVFHEDMHDEAFTYTRHTLEYPPPRFTSPLPPLPREELEAGPLPGDAHIPGGTFVLGPRPGEEPFVFDNEKWGHQIETRPFAIARAQVTQGEFQMFVDDRGYERPELWSDAGRRWLEEAGSKHPVYWRREAPGRWSRRHFDRWAPLEPHRAIIHVCWYEADAYARWAGRRLPTEAEWEVAAAGEPDPSDPARLAANKRRFPWGNEPPRAEHANLDWRAMGTIDVAGLPRGDSAFGVRQMIGNVWEWTSSDFLPYPGFVADPYKEYSEPWFGDHKILRGGCWTTRARLLRNTWRNFYKPNRRDVLAGFRTCAK